MAPESTDGQMSRRAFIGRALQIAGSIGVAGSLADAVFIHYREDKLANDGNPAEPLLVRQADWVLDEHQQNPTSASFDWENSPDPSLKLPIDEAQSVKLYEARRKSEIPISHDPVSETLMKPGVPAALKISVVSIGAMIGGALLRRDIREPIQKSQQGKPTLRHSGTKLA